MFTKLLAVVGLITTLTSCSGAKISDSETQHLGYTMPVCAVNKDRSDYLYQNLGPYVYGDANVKYYFMQQISMAPNILTDYIVARAKAGQFQVRFDLGNGYAGLTTGGFDGSQPSLMQFPPDYENVRQAALHELGHAVEYYSFYLAGKPQNEASEVQAAYANAVGREGQNMWSYATSNRYEWFASSFSQYWCSAQSRATMQTSYPNTLAFMNSLYANLKSGSQTPATKSQSGSQTLVTGDASKDSDGDGINDAEDFCPNTPKGATVSTKGMYRGCSGGQKTINMKGSASADDDGDGVANYFDVCPNTVKGGDIYTSGTYRGCTGGQKTLDLDKARIGE